MTPLSASGPLNEITRAQQLNAKQLTECEVSWNITQKIEPENILVGNMADNC